MISTLSIRFQVLPASPQSSPATASGTSAVTATCRPGWSSHAQVSQLSPQLQNNVQSVAKDLEAQDAAAQTDREALLEGVKQWDAVLAELRTLGGG